MTAPGKRGGKMSRLALVDEVMVWLEVNGNHVVSWMCTPDHLEELAVGWLYGEGYISGISDLASLTPCAPDLGFRATISPDLVDAVDREDRQRVLASGCGAVSTLLSDPASVVVEESRGDPPGAEVLRSLFKQVFQSGERYRDTGGVHAAALARGADLRTFTEDIGRHNAVDKVIGEVILAGESPEGMGLLVTGRISAELAFKASRAGLVYVATPSIPSRLAATIAGRSGMTLVGRAVSGTPHIHSGREEGA